MEESIAEKWKMEHEEIIGEMQDVVKNFTTGDRMGVKKAIKRLNKSFTNHVTEEDRELYNLLRQDILGGAINDEIEIFKKTFKELKVELMAFLTKNARPDQHIDEVFFIEFNDYIDKIMERFRWEESGLYKTMKEECICRIDLEYED